MPHLAACLIFYTQLKQDIHTQACKSYKSHIFFLHVIRNLRIKHFLFSLVLEIINVIVFITNRLLYWNPLILFESFAAHYHFSIVELKLYTHCRVYIFYLCIYHKFIGPHHFLSPLLPCKPHNRVNYPPSEKNSENIPCPALNLHNITLPTDEFKISLSQSFSFQC